MMDSRILALSIVAIILIIIAAIGFYLYGTTLSTISSLKSSYSSLSSSYSTVSSQLSQYMTNYSSLKAEYSKLESNYTALEGMYNMLLAMEKMYMNEAIANYTLFKQAEMNASYYKTLYEEVLAELKQINATGIKEEYKEGSALGVVLQFYDGIAIENPNDVLPFLAPNFTAEIMGVPFAGNYTYSTFNSTWLADFFSTYETVYFYTTALPTITVISNNTFAVTDVVQYFVAPTNDPVYLQVFNASNTITVQIIHGVPLITKLVWNGNEVPPSTVIAGYPSQHVMQANQVLEEFLYQVNAIGAEFPPNVITQYFSPNATFVVEGQLPSVFKTGVLTGSEITNFFNTWDTYFIFTLEYSQNILPNGTAIPPMVKVTLTPSGTMAVVTANETVFFTFVNQGQPGFPAIYDMHVNVTAYFMYNSTAAEWQIVKETWYVMQVQALSDTIYYNLNTPMFIVNGENTTVVNANSGNGYVLQLGNMMVIIKPHTYAELANGTLLSTYNFSLVSFSLEAIMPPAADFSNLTPLYAFAFAVNGQITPAISLVTNVSGKLVPNAPITIVFAPDTWTSWTWFGGTFNGTVYTGGSYKFADHWLYGDGVMVNTVFFKPVIWIFEAAQTPVGMPPKMVNVMVSPAYGFLPINSYTFEINGTTGGVAYGGNILVVIPPGTIVKTPSGDLTVYNFSIVYYALTNVPSPESNQTPILAFAYAVNGNTTFAYSFVNEQTGANQPVITVIFTPNMGANMWTWGPQSIIGKGSGYGYLFHDVIINGRGVVINLTFFKPVPWVLTLPYPYAMMSTTTSSSASTSSSSSSSTTTSSTVTMYWG
ncbi:MAG: hypothetical protein OWQ54_06425 [Sulfolobaceae archaeon]|nr:hypothetical protein [Sulfolobaceae archaeon]